MALNIPAYMVAGEFVDELDWNGLVDSLTFLANPPACRVYNNAAISIAHATIQALTFNTERFDPTGMHSTSTNTGRITFADAGLYYVVAHVELAAATDYQHRILQLRLNGATAIASPDFGPVSDISVSPGMTSSTLYKFAAGDYVEAVVYQKNAAAAARNVQVAANYTPEFSAVWMGLG